MRGTRGRARGCWLADPAQRAERQATMDLPAVLPAAVVDLRTADGAALVGARWRYSDARIVEVDHHAAGPDLRPSGPPNRTNDISPTRARPTSTTPAWETIAPAALETRRGNGRLAFNWYRTRVTLPAKVGAFDVAGSTVVFELVRGRLRRGVGGRAAAAGAGADRWTAGEGLQRAEPRRAHARRAARPADPARRVRDQRPGVQPAGQLHLGPLGDARLLPRRARSARAAARRPRSSGSIRALDAIVPKGATVEKLAGGFQFIEGPVWHPDGYLLFSDPNANTIYRWTPDGAVSVFRTKSGYTGVGHRRVPPAGLERAHPRPRTAGSRSTSTATGA